MDGKKYIIEAKDLKIGDIILTADNSKTSLSIRIGINGDFSHAIIYAGDYSYIHSVDKIVRSDNIQRLLFDEIHHVKVLRLRDSTVNISAACIYARTQVGKSYSKIDALRSQIGGKSISNRQYCSRLVAESYQAAGIKIVENPPFCDPEDIHCSDQLIVAPVLIREATEEEIIFSLLPNPLSEQDRITANLFSSFRRITGADIQTDEQVISFLTRNPQFDRQCTVAEKESGYLDMWKWDMDTNPWRYDKEQFECLPLSEDDLAKLAEREWNSAKIQYERFSFNVRELNTLLVKNELAYIKQKIELYKFLCGIALSKMTMFDQYRNKIN
ncbi:YiiX/YebB-like N1pC/P60 family cysteine hydrolase [Azospirillum argentinense]|uniref:YiiX/YebB-like N1pC/P60 family cysteine hydrolase n=1 Tax=Azospirillum argentinense TaxID=2970906 RepID=A0ABW8VHV7_9PROT